MRKAREDLIKEKMFTTSQIKSDDEEETADPDSKLQHTSTTLTSGNNKETFLKQKLDKTKEKQKKIIDEYKNDFLKYFEMKLTKQEMILDSTNSNQANKIPKRKQLNDKDSIEAIAANI
jgi:hypothetical protein